MPPSFITKRLAPCAGTPVHTLVCGHTIHASFLHPSTSSKCAPNCKAVGMSTNAEPSFLCPVCFEAYLHSQYSEFQKRCELRGRLDKQPRDIIVRQAKGTYDSGVKGELNEINSWYDVWLGETTFEKVGRESYKWALEQEGSRGCKAVGKEETE